jgi:serine/threonine protein kinase
MKEKKIIHRDLKLNNILLDVKDFNTYNYTIKIADFGCSKYGTHFYKNDVGTRLYQAPELLFDNKKKEKKNEKVDVWSLGVIAYLFEQKKYPFKDANEIMTKSLEDYTKEKKIF